MTTGSNPPGPSGAATCRRRQGVTVRKPIIIGTYSAMISQAEQTKRRLRGDNATHAWACIVRAPNNENQSYYIRRVVFTLHPSFTNPTRTVEEPPFILHEYGWGEFDISVRLVLVDGAVDKKYIDMKHTLRLYEPGVDIRLVKPHATQRLPLLACETYDEILFHEPPEKFYDRLMLGPTELPLDYGEYEAAFKKHDVVCEEYMNKLAKGAVVVQREIDEAKLEIIDATRQIRKLKELYFMLRPDEASVLLSKDWRPDIPERFLEDATVKEGSDQES